MIRWRLVFCVVMLSVVAGCVPKSCTTEGGFFGPPTDLQPIPQWKTALQSIYDEIATLEKDLLETTDADEMVSLKAKVTRLRQIAAAINEKAQEAESPLDLVDLGLSAATGAFPPAAIALALWRGFRRARKRTVVAEASTEHVFTSIGAGGGPVDGDAAKAEMLKNPEVWTMFKKWKTANGG